MLFLRGGGLGSEPDQEDYGRDWWLTTKLQTTARSGDEEIYEAERGCS